MSATYTDFTIEGCHSLESAFRAAREHVDGLGDWQNEGDDPWRNAYRVNIALITVTNDYVKGGYGSDNNELVFHFRATIV